MAEYGELRGCPFKGEELVTYQKGTVVSKTIFKEKNGTITVFAFAEGQALSEHTAPYEAFVQVIDGMGEITIDGQSHEIPAGSAIIMPADVPHSVRAVESFKMILTMIRG